LGRTPRARVRQVARHVLPVRIQQLSVILFADIIHVLTVL
jgi:hypothetical protein